MNIEELVKDSIKYPFSDWIKFFILGIMLLTGNLYFYVGLFTQNNGLVIILTPLWIIFSLLISGYTIRIIESSLIGELELPNFNALGTMFIDGFKLQIVSFVYAIPALIIAFFATIVYNKSALYYVGLPSFDANMLLNFGTLGLIIILYLIVIIPIFLIAIANMTSNNCEFNAAFRFGEILNKIKNISWINFLKWYIVTGIIYLVILTMGDTIVGSLKSSFIIGGVLLSLIVVLYTKIFLFRSVALVYKSE